MRQPKSAAPKRRRRPKGEGTVFWYAAIGKWIARIPFVDPLTGRTKAVRRQFQTEREALEFRRSKIREKDRGIVAFGEIRLDKQLGLQLSSEAIAFPEGSLGRAYLAFLQGVLKDELAPHTYDSRLSRARRHILPGIGHQKAGNLTPSTISNLFQRMKASQIGVPTRIEVRRDLHAFFERIGPEGLRLIAQNPITKAHRFEKHAKRTKSILEPAEYARALQSIAGLIEDQELPRQLESIAAMVAFSLTTGAARGECIPRIWSDWSEDDHSMKIASAASRASGKGLFTKDPKNNFRIRSVPVPEMMESILTVLKSRTSSVYCFPSTVGGMVDLRAVNREFEALRTLINLPSEMSFGDCRSTFRSLLDGRAGSRTLMELMGHSKPSTGEQHYARGIDDYKRAAAQVIESLANS